MPVLYETVSGKLADADRRCELIKRYWIERGYYGIEARPVIEQHESVLVPGTREAVVVIKTNIGPRGFPPRDRAA